jgi:hypothetical protein
VPQACSSALRAATPALLLGAGRSLLLLLLLLLA